MNNFHWLETLRNQSSSNPFFCLAPMADVTDMPFRSMFARYGKPDITWTEFVSSDGLFLRPVTPYGRSTEARETCPIDYAICDEYGIGYDHPLLHDLVHDKSQYPCMVQFFSKDPDRMERSARLAVALGYDGIDINMGCPADVICNQGAGSAMIRTPLLAQELVRRAKIGAQGKIPVSVKTRVGYNVNELETWLPYLLQVEPDCITLHARTRKEMSKVPAHWQDVARAVEIRNDLAPHVIIIGNGDISSQQDGIQRAQEARCDGVMVGRGVFGNPWFFSKTTSKQEQSSQYILEVLREHIMLFDTYLGHVKSFAVMKKHFKAYCSARPELAHVKDYLIQECNNAQQSCAYIDEIRTNIC